MAQLLPTFNGGFYTTRLPILGSDRAVNLYTETRQAPGSAKQKWMYGTPGLVLLGTADQVVCRGWFTQDGRTFTVIGAILYEATTITASSIILVQRDVIPLDDFPVSFATNGLAGNQLAVVGGGQLHVLNLLTNTATTVALPFTNPVMVVFADGYGLINERDTPTVWFSALEDFTTWDALDFFTRSGTSDNIVAIALTRDRLWTLGSKTSTQYYDSGDADNPWQPYPGTTLQVGCITPYAVTVYNDVLRWLGLSAKGEPRFIQATPDAKVLTFSTPPINDFLMACSTLADVEALFYEQASHPFYVFTAPSSPDDIQTYHFDTLENEWGARAGYDTATGQFRRWRVRGITAVDQLVICGDYATGQVYALDLHTYTDNSVTIARERIAPYLFPPENQFAFVSEVELACQNGLGLETGADEDEDPQVELLISRDGGETWVSAGFAPEGLVGNYNTRTIWHRLGRFRRDRGLFRMRKTTATPTGWYGLWVSAEGSTNQL